MNDIVTSVVQVYKGHLDDARDIYLIDTPGFDDTYRSDTEILGEIANWLGNTYSHKITLTGIIYLHRIVDTRVGGSAMKNLQMFKELCGDNGLPSVVLATTFWSKDEKELHTDRENQLATQPEYWSIMIAKGSRMFRHDQDQRSAVAIVEHLLALRRPTVLAIQRQLIDDKKTLDQTSAGQILQVQTEWQRLAFEKELQDIKIDMRVAIETKNRETEEELKVYREEVQSKLARIEKDGFKLQADSEALQRQLVAELEEDREAIFQEMQKNDDKLQEQKILLALSELQYKHDLEIQERQFQINKLNAEKAALARQARPWWEKLFE